jgi:RNA polymerase sigma-70 factor (ECF subfamily)
MKTCSHGRKWEQNYTTGEASPQTDEHVAPSRQWQRLFASTPYGRDVVTIAGKATTMSKISGHAAEFRPASGADVTGLLLAWRNGDAEARDRLMATVYQDLKRRAASQLRREDAGHTLQPTALVHEAYLRLVKQDRTAWQNRAQFFGVASQMMRRILVDHARARNRIRRSGSWTRVTLDQDLSWKQGRDVDVLDLDRALGELATFDARKSQIAEQRFFGGLSLEETGYVLDLSVATVEREWQAARAWLYSRLTGKTSRSQPE